jgi:hypothetical protein
MASSLRLCCDVFGRGSVFSVRRYAFGFSWKEEVLHTGSETRATAGSGVREDLSFERKEKL